MGYQYADATLFQDPKSNKTYVYWRSRVNPQNTGFRAMELTDDCLSIVPESDTQLFTSANREAPAMFYANEQYYLWTSGCDGWAPTTIHLYTADSVPNTVPKSLIITIRLARVAVCATLATAVLFDERKAISRYRCLIHLSCMLAYM